MKLLHALILTIWLRHWESHELFLHHCIFFITIWENRLSITRITLASLSFREVYILDTIMQPRSSHSISFGNATLQNYIETDIIIIIIIIIIFKIPFCYNNHCMNILIYNINTSSYFFIS